MSNGPAGCGRPPQVAVTPPAAIVEFATFHEGYLSRYIQLADAKAGAALIVVAAVLGYLLGNDKVVADLKCLPLSGASLLAAAAVVTLVVAGAMAFAVIAPRQLTEGTGFVFWGDAAGMSSQSFRDRVHAEGVEGIADERLAHAHTLAKVCVAKYRWLRRSLFASGVGAVLAAAVRLSA